MKTTRHLSTGSSLLLLGGCFATLLCALLCAVGGFDCHEATAQEPTPINEEEYAKDSSTEINVKNADIAAIVRIFSKKTKRNYILDENVKGKVSIYLPGKVSSEEAIRILDSVLNLKGFTSVPIGQNLWKIVFAKDAKQSTIPTITDDSKRPTPSAAIVTRLVNLKYIKAEDLQQLLGQLISGNGLLNAYTGTNSLLMIDSEDNVDRLVKIIHSLDVPFSNREMTIIPIQHADVVDIAEKLVEILGEGSGQQSGADQMRASMGLSVPNPAANAANQAQNLGRPAGMPATGSTQTVSARGLEPKIIPDERTNSIIVVADEDMTARIRALVSQLDSKIDLSGNRFYVYRCQHANAEDLAEVLSGLVGGTSGGTSRSGSGLGSGTTPQGGFEQDAGYGLGGSSSNRNLGSRSRGGRTSGTQNRNRTQQRTPGRSRSENGRGAGGAGTVNFGEDISITADPATNSLIINAGKTDYEKILSLLQKLDIKRRQVLVEAMLLEVAVDDTTNLGTEFLVSNGGKDGGVLAKSDFGNLASLLSDPTKLSGFSAAAASAGTLTLPGNITIPTQTILLTAARRNNNVNVLSAPTILATDNEQAEIVVGQNVPFLASVATSDTNLNNTFNQIDRQDVGITLRLTPQISSRDFVTLKIFTEVSNVVAVSPELGPTTTIRTSETTVITKDSQMIVTGGLMSDDSTEAQSGVPFLEDVPVLGHLFRVGSQNQRRTNLLIFITPKIVKDQFDARDATIVRRDNLEDVISKGEFEPDRREILRRDSIDKVSEYEPYEGPKPSTIYPPAKTDANHPAVSNLPDRIEPELPARKPAAVEEDDEEQAGAEIEEDEDPDALDLEASPELPTAPSAAPANSEAQIFEQVDVESQRAALRRNEAPGQAERQAGSNARYVVMQIKPGTKIPGNIPFTVNKDRLVFGVIVPESSANDAKRFFEPGNFYSYHTNGQALTVRPLGSFNNEEEALGLYPDIGSDWYTLSPHEVMNLGDAPWTKTK